MHKVILLGMSPISDHACVMGRDKYNRGVLRIYKYKRNAKTYTYNDEVQTEDLGRPILTLVFARADSIRKMAEGLGKLADAVEEVDHD